MQSRVGHSIMPPLRGSLQPRSNINVYSLRIRITRQPRLSQLPANPTLLHATKWHSEVTVVTRVNPYHACLQSPRNAMRALDILREHGRAEAVDSLVCHIDRLPLSLKRGDDNEGSEDLFFIDVHLGLDIREDGRLDEVPLAITNVGEALTATNQLRTLVFARFREAKDALVLHLGDLGPLVCGCSEGVANYLDFRDVFGEFRDE